MKYLGNFWISKNIDKVRLSENMKSMYYKYHDIHIMSIKKFECICLLLLKSVLNFNMEIGKFL